MCSYSNLSGKIVSVGDNFNPPPPTRSLSLSDLVLSTPYPLSLNVNLYSIQIPEWCHLQCGEAWVRSGIGCKGWKPRHWPMTSTQETRRDSTASSISSLSDCGRLCPWAYSSCLAMPLKTWLDLRPSFHCYLLPLRQDFQVSKICVIMRNYNA